MSFMSQKLTHCQLYSIFEEYFLNKLSPCTKRNWLSFQSNLITSPVVNFQLGLLYQLERVKIILKEINYDNAKQ